MSSFFDLPDVPDHTPPQKRYRTPRSLGPPPATIPAVVPVEGVIARTEDVAVVVAALQVFPEGLELEVLTFSRPQDEVRDDGAFDPMAMHYPHVRSTLTDDVLRVGVQFADGRKGTNIGEDLELAPTAPDKVVFRSRGGGGSGDGWAQTYWLWPLPDAGPLTVVCEWPAQGIPVSRLEIDGDAIRGAAARAQVIFSDDHLPEFPPGDPTDGNGWARYVPRG